MTHEEAIEVAARAMHVATNASYGRPMPSWEEIGENSREHYREQARAAIAAFLAHVEVSDAMWHADSNARNVAEAVGVRDRVICKEGTRAMLAQLAREIAPG